MRFLCSVLIKSGTRVEICKLLDPRVFEDPLQRVVFEEIRELGSIDSRRLRELLPARVANRGFPDFDLKELLAPHEVSEKEIDHLFESALQLLDFSNPDVDLDRYLAALSGASFEEVKPNGSTRVTRIWRDVPNRRWHAVLQGATASSREVVLIHRAV